MECANSHSNGDPLVGKYRNQRSADHWSGTRHWNNFEANEIDVFKPIKVWLTRLPLTNRFCWPMIDCQHHWKIILFLDVITSARQQFGGGLVGSSSSCDSSSSSSCDSPRHSPSLTNSSSSSQTSSPSPRKQVCPGTPYPGQNFDGHIVNNNGCSLRKFTRYLYYEDY